MTILLVGCGYWGQNWAKTLSQLGELSAICEPHQPTRALIADKYPGIPIFDDLQTALCHPVVEGVVIATPVITHGNVAQQCIQAKKHVLIEKPMTLTVPESQELVQLADSHHVKLAVGHILMYHPALLKLQQLIRQGELGDILSVQCTRVNLGKIRNEENVWWSLAPHDISIISMLLEEPFQTTAATKMLPLGRPKIEDTVYATFETASGRQASIHVSWLSHVKRHETVVIGTRKIAVFEDTQPLDKKLMLLDYDMQRSEDSVQSIQRNDASFVPFDMPDELLALEAKGFIQAFRENLPLQNDGNNGVQVVRILEEVQTRLNHQKTYAMV